MRSGRLPPETPKAAALGRFEEEGYLLLDSLVGGGHLSALRQEADRLLALSNHRGGARNALQKSLLFRNLARDRAVSRWPHNILGRPTHAFKLTIFDKHTAANWKVHWHQDLTLAVKERRDVPGCDGWSEKEGVPHVRPPASVLRQVVALRLHLDDTPADNGALRVLPGSHRYGTLDKARIQELRQQGREVLCEIPAGGALLMSPLLLHASSAASRPRRRRVLHFEYGAGELPGGLEWP